MVFLMPTNSAAKSASLHTHFLWMDFTKRRTAASMTICTLHFMIHYKFISLTDSNLAFSPTMSATAGGGAVYSMLSRPRDTSPSSSTWSLRDIWHLDLSLLPEASLSSLSSSHWLLLPHFLCWLLLTYLIKFWSTQTQFEVLFSPSALDHILSLLNLINSHGFKYHSLRQQLLNFLFPTWTTFFSCICNSTSWKSHKQKNTSNPSISPYLPCHHPYISNHHTSPKL